MRILKLLFGYKMKSNNEKDLSSIKNDYKNCIEKILVDIDYNLKYENLSEEYYLLRFEIFNRCRILDLVFNNNNIQPVRTYLLNTENGIVDYKNTKYCYTLDMLDIISGTSSRNSNIFFGKNRQDGIYQLTIEQNLKNYYDILLDNKSMIYGLNWIPKDKIDELYSEKMGYTTIAGWQPDSHLLKIENELSFLKNNDFFKYYDDNELPEYKNQFIWEKYMKFEKSDSNEKIEIMIDYRGQADFMRFILNNIPSKWEKYDIEVIRLKYS